MNEVLLALVGDVKLFRLAWYEMWTLKHPAESAALRSTFTNLYQ